MNRVNSPIKRRPTRQIHVGKVAVGGDAPVSVQTMTNTRTEDVESTVAQILSAAKAGADIVRVSVPTMEAAEAFRRSGKDLLFLLLRTFTLTTASRSRSPSTELTASGSTRATSGARTGSRQSSTRRRSTASPSGLVSTAAPWRRISWRSTESRLPRRSWSPRCAMLPTSRSTTFLTSR